MRLFLPYWWGRSAKGRAISTSSNRSGVPSGLSRFASQAKPLLSIAGEALVVLILLACLILPAVFAGA